MGPKFSSSIYLFNTSIEGVSGSWIPAVIITTPPGIYDYIFTRENDFYTLDAGYLPIGNCGMKSILALFSFQR